jgi:hypothetical protein
MSLLKKVITKTSGLITETNLSNVIVYAEFPKSGITVGSAIITSLFLRSFDASVPVVNRVNYSHYIGTLSNPIYTKNYGFAKTHETYASTMKNVIYFVRDPVDVMGSYWEYLFKRGTISSLLLPIDFLLKTPYGINAWANHVRSYLSAPLEGVRHIWLRYESLISGDKTILDIAKLYSLEVLPDNLAEFTKKFSIETWKEHEKLWNCYNLPATWASARTNYNNSFVGRDPTIAPMRGEVEELTRHYLSNSKEMHPLLDVLGYSRYI